MRSWAAGSGYLAAAPEQAEAGPTGLFVVILLAIGIFFLGRSMIKHMRRVPQSFDPPPDRETDTSRETYGRESDGRESDGRETDGRETPPSG